MPRVLFLSSTLVALSIHIALAVNVSIPLSAPANAPKLNPALISLSIEQDRWTDWVGKESRNDFFYNTLTNLRDITGHPIDIRIGANSEDRTDFDPNVKFSEGIFPAPTAIVPYPETSKMVVGDEYYRTTRFLPPNTHVTWGLNFGTNNNTASLLQAKSILKAFASPEFKAKNLVLDFLEFGNEPDLYRNNGLRPTSYNLTTYVAEWIAMAKNVTSEINLASTSTKLLGGSFATSSRTTSGFGPQGMWQAGILESEPGKLINTYSQHRYSGSFCTGSGGLLQDLMTKSTIRGNLSVFNPDIAATRARGLDYILGETNSYSCHGAPGVSNSAGAALWTLDYALFSPIIGISKVFFHVGIGFKYNLIQPATLYHSILDATPLPEPLPPHVQPQYYAAIIAAEAIGKSGTTQAIELSIDHPRVAGYGFFERGRLARAVFINSLAYFRGSTANRTSIHLDLAFTGGGTVVAPAPRNMRVKRLAIGFADDDSGLTWAGQTYETASGKVSGNKVIRIQPIAGGLDIAQTEVVLVEFI